MCERDRREIEGCREGEKNSKRKQRAGEGAAAKREEEGSRSGEKGKGNGAERRALWHSSLRDKKYDDSCFSVLVLPYCLAEQPRHKDWDLCSK